MKSSSTKPLGSSTEYRIIWVVSYLSLLPTIILSVVLPKKLQFWDHGSSWNVHAQATRAADACATMAFQQTG